MTIRPCQSALQTGQELAASSSPYEPPGSVGAAVAEVLGNCPGGDVAEGIPFGQPVGGEVEPAEVCLEVHHALRRQVIGHEFEQRGVVLLDIPGSLALS